MCFTFHCASDPKPSANLFLELGFAAEEAERYQVESRKRIDETLALKVQLMSELAKWIKDNHLKQEQAAEIFKVTRPRIFDVVNKKPANSRSTCWLTC